MSQTTPRLDLPLIQPAQAQKHVTHNEAIVRLDAITHLSVVARDVNAVPSSPDGGSCYAVGAAPMDDWVGHAGTVAAYSNGGWIFVTPQDGWRMWDLSKEELCVFQAGIWVPTSSDLQNLEGLGVNTTSDAQNRLSVSSGATLFTHETERGGHQLKVNKATNADTASLLFQTGFSGRAEMGTAGTDDFAIKVSNDGTNFTTALSFDAATGLASGVAVQQSPDDVTPGRLMRTDYGYGPANILGTVNQSGGNPTGAVFERGANSNGNYVRYADGTQICWRASELTYEDTSNLSGDWDYPVPFATSAVSISAMPDADSFESTSTPNTDELGTVVASGVSDSKVIIKQYRVAGLTDFQPADVGWAHVTATGRWF